jgi:sulfite reductase alpha subunit-like flavoprotein
MPIDVMDALKEVIGRHVNDTDGYIKTMENEKRLQLETWA